MNVVEDRGKATEDGECRFCRTLFAIIPVSVAGVAVELLVVVLLVLCLFPGAEYPRLPQRIAGDPSGTAHGSANAADPAGGANQAILDVAGESYLRPAACSGLCVTEKMLQRPGRR